MDRHLRTIAHK